MKHILILVNGTYGDYSFCQNVTAFDYIICADNGMHHARKLELVPDLIVGDFDSVPSEDLDYFKRQQVKIEAFNPHKDATDTEIAVMRAIALKPDKITIWGGVGTRMDHSLANIQMLYKMMEAGITGTLVNPHNQICLVWHQKVLTGKKEELVSLIPFSSEVKGITTQGLAYPLENATMSFGTSLGVSNVMLDERAVVTVKEGILIVIQAKD